MTETETLYQQHVYDSPAVDDWIDFHGGDIEKVRAFGQIGEMRGQFERHGYWHIYQYKFIPGDGGSCRAVVMPVLEAGETIDIVAFSADDSDEWGTVTGAGRFLNYDAIYDKSRVAPLEICESYWHFLRTGCKGVMALRVDAIPELRHAGDLLVDDPSLAMRLLYEAWLWPLNVDPASAAWKAAKVEGRRRIFTDYGEAG